MFHFLAQAAEAAPAVADAAKDVTTEASSLLDTVTSVMSWDSIISFCIHLIGVILLLLIGFWVAKWGKKITTKACLKGKLDETLSQFIGKGVYWLILVSVVLACLSIFGIETTSVAAVIGAAGLAVGLAFQGTLSNLAAGVMIIIFRPFKLGDYVTVDGQSGTVNEIDFFQTTLITVDNRVIIVPNSKIYGSTIENVTAKETRRVDVNVGVAYEADIDETRKVLETAAKVEGALEDPASAIVMCDLGESAVSWQVRVWCKTADYWGVRERVVSSIKKNLDGAKIEIPYPQITISNK